jgi:hypothetical protein
MAEEQKPGAEREQELIQELQAELAKLKVSDLLLQSVYTISSLGYHRLSGDAKDLEQARLAIEGARALQDLVPQEGLQQVRDALAQLQMAYAREARAEPAAGGPQPAEPAKPADADEADERAKARSKIWTPPGS